jgi:hypothetical protein
MDSETPKEIAKATGEVAKLGSKAIEFCEKLVGAPAEQLGGWIADEIAFLRTKRRMTMEQVLEGARKQLEARGEEPTTVPSKILVPLLTEGSLKDEELLIDRWATLLANAADRGAASRVQPQFIRFLADLTPEEAHTLEVNFRVKGHAPRVNQRLVFPPELNLLPERAATIRDHFVRIGIARYRLSASGLEGSPSDVKELEDIYFTITGVEFLLACHAPLDDDSHS